MAQVLGEDRSVFRARVEQGTLVRTGLVRLRGDTPFSERTAEPGDAVWTALSDIDVWPADIGRPASEIVTSGLDEWFDEPEVSAALRAIASGTNCSVLVIAESAEVAFYRGLALVASAGAQPAGVLLPAGSNADLETLASLHSILRGAVAVVQVAEPDGPATPQAPMFQEHPGPVVICGRRGALSLRGSRPIVVVPAGRLTVGAHRRMWSELAPELDGEAARLAARYPIEPAYAAEAVRDVRSFVGSPICANRISAAIQARSSLALSGGVQLVRPTATREDLVLHPTRMQQVDEALNRLLHQQRVLDEWGFLQGRPGARGVRMLFAGPPGTGKTLTAEVMAKALNMDLLVVDIARVVSKWIGETEKNLAAVFDTAERARAVLLFDEADALFGRRTEVSDAHDRYANLETAYLLARLERFEGLAILSTNLRQNIDAAFVRRLGVNFDEPGREERIALWNVHLPARAPIAADVNTRELANLFPVVGALIRNASVAAGFLAAADGGMICRSHLLHGLRREYEKAGKAFPALPANMSGGRSGISGRVETKEETWQ
jgi:hypothetical protein